MSKKPANFDPSSTAQPGTSTSVKHLASLSNNTVEQNLDGVLQTIKTMDQTCRYDRCKTKTNLMGQDCEFCLERYCFKHSLPEIHGCGEAVRRDERKKFLRPEPAKTVQRREELTKAKSKLHAKLNDMNLSRKQKQPGTDSSKAKKK